MLNGLI